MKNLVVALAFALFGLFAAGNAEAQPRAAACEPMLPAGLVIRLYPDETVTAGVTEGPVIFTVTSDVLLFRGQPPIVPRGSKVFGRVTKSQQAGRLVGRAQYEVVFTSLMTPDRCVYPLDAKVQEAGNYRIEDNTIVGRGHPRRDALLLLFPPTTLYQLLRFPARGPQLVIDVETPIGIKLMDAVYADRAGPILSSAPQANAPELRSAQPAGGAPTNARPCTLADKPARSPLWLSGSVLRPVRNLTNFHVTLLVDGRKKTDIPPCFMSTVAAPAGEFRLQATAAHPSNDGQREVFVELVVNGEGTGWDIVQAADRRIP